MASVLLSKKLHWMLLYLEDIKSIYVRWSVQLASISTQRVGPPHSCLILRVIIVPTPALIPQRPRARTYIIWHQSGPPLSNGDEEKGTLGHHRRKMYGSLWAAKEITARIESALTMLRLHSMRLVARRNTTGSGA